MKEFILDYPITIALISLTVYVSYMFWKMSAAKQDEFLLYPYQIFRNNNLYSLVSSVFIHSSWEHLLFNMFSLFFLGPYLENIVGPLNYIALYITSAVLGSLFLVFKYKNVKNYCALGASGAVSGIVFAFIALNPNAELQFFIVPIAIPAYIFGAIYLMASIYRSKFKSDHIAHEAHLGGAFMGILYVIGWNLF